ncbi:MAG TPA: HypC/HybG/HupF family hydrogenase formation chaperone [Pirellulales bacterium]|nr:HypC/HybG/HupF family hydrogenase formation chaperone [Pirellulales bacterium]
MCLAIPAQVCELFDEQPKLALVDVLGVRRKISIDLLRDDSPNVGDWVLVHVGFALSKISAEQAEEQLKLLSALGEASVAREELASDQIEDRAEARAVTSAEIRKPD